MLDAPYLRRSAVTEGRPWRLPFLGGLVLGGVIAAVLGGGWAPTWDLGMFDAVIGWGAAGKVAWMFGGDFVGIAGLVGTLLCAVLAFAHFESRGHPSFPKYISRTAGSARSKEARRLSNVRPPPGFCVTGSSLEKALSTNRPSEPT